MLSHLSIYIALYAIRAIKAISISPSPQVRAYFRSFMGRNRLKKSSARAPNASAGEEDVRQGLRGLFQFVPKKLEQDFSVFTCDFARFAESCSNSVFRIGTGFSRIYQALWSFVPIVPVFNKSSIYKNIYRDPFLYSSSRALGLKIIGTNGTFSENPSYYGKNLVPTPILRIGTTGTNGQFSGKNPHK